MRETNSERLVSEAQLEARIEARLDRKYDSKLEALSKHNRVQDKKILELGKIL